MAGVKTRRHSDSKLSELVGPGKEFIPSEVPTLRAIIQKGILIRDRLVLEQGSAKKDVRVKDIVDELVPLIVAQWQISNAKFAPPVTIKEDSIRAKVERLWGKVEEVKRGRAGKGKGGGKGKGKMEREKVELLLDKLVDITTCPHSIQLCNEPDSGCKDVKKCKFQAHVKCDCPYEKKVPVLELRWLYAQRAKKGEKSSMMMSTDDKPETEKQRKAEKRRCDEIEADMKRKKRQNEEEQLLMQQNAGDEVELEECELGNQEMAEQEEENMFAPSPAVVKEQEEEAVREVDALLEEKLGEFAQHCIELHCFALHWNVVLCI